MKIEISFDTPLRLEMVQPSEPLYRAVFTVQYNDVNFKGEYMSSQMASGSYATVSVQWNDKGGNPVKVDGHTKWESSDPTIVECTVSTGNPLIANLHSLGPVGKVQVHASADADLSESVKTISAPPYDVEVISGQAVMGEITFQQFAGQVPPAKTGAAAPPPAAHPTAPPAGGTPKR